MSHESLWLKAELDEVIEIVAALVARNSLLERLVAALKARRNKAEGVSKEQLSLAELAEIALAGGDVDTAIDAADEALKKAAEDNGGCPEVIPAASAASAPSPAPAGAEPREEPDRKAPMHTAPA